MKTYKIIVKIFAIYENIYYLCNVIKMITKFFNKNYFKTYEKKT